MFVLEIVFIIISSHQNILPINIFDHDFFCTPYADDTTFFIKDFVTELLKTLDNFSALSGQKLNKLRSKIKGKGIVKVKVALCRQKCHNLEKSP